MTGTRKLKKIKVKVYNLSYISPYVSEIMDLHNRKEFYFNSEMKILPDINDFSVNEISLECIFFPLFHSLSSVFFSFSSSGMNNAGPLPS